MTKTVFGQAGALVLAVAVLLGAPAPAPVLAETKATHDHTHDHGKNHAHSHDHSHDDKDIQKGYFEDSQIAPRALSDWAGEWQSVYPLLQDGTLDPVMAHKAEHGEKTAQEYREYYGVGYKTDVEKITISGDQISFARKDGTVTGQYADDGYEILNYKKGNRGVRFIFKKVGGDEAAPAFIQFSDHHIAPEKVGHYHLYWGADRARILTELTNWPTYYPADLGAQQIVDEMLAH